MTNNFLTSGILVCLDSFCNSKALNFSWECSNKNWKQGLIMLHLVASIFRFSRFLHLFPRPQPFFWFFWFFFFFCVSGELIAVYFTLVVLSSIVFAFALKKLDSLGQTYIHTYIHQKQFIYSTHLIHVSCPIFPIARPYWACQRFVFVSKTPSVVQESQNVAFSKTYSNLR